MNREQNKQLQQAKMLQGYSPVFSRFGQSIYASDVVQMCIDIIATECSKLRPKHIRTGADGIQAIPKSALNRLFKFAPNPIMTTKDFIEKVIWLLYLNYNAFIYPVYEATQEQNGGWTREYKAFYPLNPTQVTFLQDAAGTLFAKMQFAAGHEFTIAYSEIIHLRKKFSVSDILGGGMGGQPDNAALLKVLQINDTVLQGLEKAIKSSLSIRGVVRINTMLDDVKQEDERKRLEKAIEEGTSGLIALDLKGDYIPLNPDVKLLDKQTLEFLQNKVLCWYGVSVPILTGDFNDEQYQAFYEKTLEPIVIGMGQAFSKCLFSTTELSHGNEMVFYQRDMMYLSTKAKLELLKTAGEQGLLTDDQKLHILGYGPIEGGNRRTISLNYISTEIADEYQMKKAGSKKDNKDKDDE